MQIACPQRFHLQNCRQRHPLRPRPLVAPLAATAGPNTAGEVETLVQGWARRDPLNCSRKEVLRYSEDGQHALLRELLGQRLEFGTAGLRGKMGPGYNRMNHVVVQQTAQGLYRYLHEQCPGHLAEHGIVIGHDARHGSLLFARITAAVFLSKGVPVHLFSKVVPTPFVAAGVSVLGAAAGVMVTASHNPKEYNGYKVYWGNGCQIIPPHDEGIAAAIDQELELWPLTGSHRQGSNPSTSTSTSTSGTSTRGTSTSFSSIASISNGITSEQEAAWRQAVDAAATHPLVQDPTTAVSQEYYARLATLRCREAAAAAGSQPVVYTPLHGVGAPFVWEAFKVMGLPAPILVASQEQPDPEFPTVVFPNPEEGKGTWALAFETGEATGSRLLLANDPDADRLAVAERNAACAGGWQTFSGNEIGILLADWLWQNVRRKHPEVPPSRYAVLSSAVSSRMLSALAAKEGLVWEETLTGFKWLGNRALELEQQGKEVLFAFEEAIGFMLGPMFRDKDGLSAAAVFAEMALDLYTSGSTVSEQLQKLYQRYGYFVYRASYFVADRPEKSKAVFERLCQGGRYPQHVGGVAVESVRDLGSGVDTSAPDGRATLPWRQGDMMLTLRLQGGAVISLRASGTEPKLKYYLEVAGADPVASAELADRLERAVAEELVCLEASGLTRPEVA